MGEAVEVEEADLTTTTTSITTHRDFTIRTITLKKVYKSTTLLFDMLFYTLKDNNYYELVVAIFIAILANYVLLIVYNTKMCS